MTIKEFVQKYKEERIIGNSDDSVQKTLKGLSDALYRGAIEHKEEAQWQIELKDVSDYYSAMFAFYAMTMNKIDQKISAVLSYYYASRVLKGDCTEGLKKVAYCVRATVVFRNNSLFQDYCGWINNYEGELQNKGHFFNILLLADYYCAEGNLLNSEVYDKMAPIAKKVAMFHSEYSKEQVILLGLEASEYLYNYICNCIKNPSFPLACL